MLPVLRGLIARRVLLNFRADRDVVQRLLPEPFVAETRGGYAIVGVCLIRLEQLRLKGLPARVGLSSENMAHRVSVRYPANGRMQPGVFIWRRETDQKLVQMFGGRLFPGVHHGATFFVQDDGKSLAMDVRSDDGETNVSFSARECAELQSTSGFSSLGEASQFFQHGDCGFSCSLKGDAVEGMQLKTARWSMQPLFVDLRKAAFYQNLLRFPAGSIEFDCGLVMRAVPHEWHEISDVPELEARLHTA
jgi:hypothetical protein